MFKYPRRGLALGMIAAGVAGTARAAAAQDDTTARTPAATRRLPADRWQLTVDTTQYLWDVRMVKLTGDTLVVRQMDSLVNVDVQRISEIRLLRKSTMRAGAVGQGVMAALTGSDDEIYDLTPLDLAARKRVIRQLLKYYPPR